MTYDAPYSWTTPEYSYTFTPISKDIIKVQSDDKQAIYDFLSTIELAGPEEGTTIPDTIYEEKVLPWSSATFDAPFYFIEVSRATVSLFLDFDVRYYMGVPTP